jgi:hypothetical protein
MPALRPAHRFKLSQELFASDPTESSIALARRRRKISPIPTGRTRAACPERRAGMPSSPDRQPRGETGWRAKSPMPRVLRVGLLTPCHIIRARSTGQHRWDLQPPRVWSPLFRSCPGSRRFRAGPESHCTFKSGRIEVDGSRRGGRFEQSTSTTGWPVLVQRSGGFGRCRASPESHCTSRRWTNQRWTVRAEADASSEAR